MKTRNLSLDEVITLREGLDNYGQYVTTRSWVGICKEIIDALYRAKDLNEDHIVEKQNGRLYIYRKDNIFPAFIETNHGDFVSTIW